MITKETFHHDLESMLELDPGTIQGEENLADFYWDSMSVVIFIAMADEKYSAVIAPAKLAEAETVADLFELVTPIA
jgi:acyl carrier protein